MMSKSFTTGGFSLATTTEDAVSYLFCALNDKLYAVEALAVREVLPQPAITELHEAPAHLSGFVYLRGQFVPVVNLSQCLNLPALPSDSNNALVVLEHDGNLAGIVVNEVQDVRSIARNRITSVAAFGLGEDGSVINCIEGIARIGEENVQLLNMSGIFALTTAYSTGGFNDYKTTQYQGEDGEIEQGQGAQVAVVNLHGELFGIDLNMVREFAPIRAITPVPSCPDSVVGLMNLRGEVLTIIDISSALYLTAPDEKREEPQVVVVECDDWKVGILVDEVLDIFGVAESEFTLPAANESSEALRGTAWFREKIMGILDVPRVLQHERRKLEEGF